MAKIIENMLDLLKLKDEDDELEEDFETKEEPEKPVKKEVVRNKPLRKYASFEEEDEDEEEAVRRPVYHPEPQRTRTAVPMRSAASDICVFHPTRFEEAQEICDMLKEKRVVLVNFEKVNDLVGGRIMDFICGALYALEANIYQVSDKNFIITPQNVEITGDIESISDGAFEVPTLSGNVQSAKPTGYR